MAVPITNAKRAQETLKELFEHARSAVFFGGAGVSTASGIPDFRSADGLYNQRFKYAPEVMLSRSFYRAHTEEFFDFYREKMLCLSAQPNRCHTKLAELEAAGKLACVITQNIDGLHQLAGSKNVLELHGSVKRNICTSCGEVFDDTWVASTTAQPFCSNCGGEVQPDVVLYEDPLDSTTLEAAVSAIAAADLLVVGGTSLVVYPAAGLINYFQGGTLVIVNRDPTPKDAHADVLCACNIAEAFDF